MNLEGITVIVCCHNSSARLPRTLEALSIQTLGDVPWEIIVVDNGSNDNTDQAAYECWPASSRAPLKVVKEPLLGLSNARRCGLSAARYEFVVFVDDDNSLAPDWLKKAHDIFVKNPNVALCGGQVLGVYERAPPDWFGAFERHLAIGRQCSKSGVTAIGHSLWGAGLGVRKSAWNRLSDEGFTFQTLDRKGEDLSSAGDQELGLVMQMAGWDIWYDHALILEHVIPPARTTWPYVRRLTFGYARSSVILEPYGHVIRQEMGILGSLRTSAIWQIGALLFHFVKSPSLWRQVITVSTEGSEDRIRFDCLVARLFCLLHMGSKYRQLYKQTLLAPWNKRFRST